VNVEAAKRAGSTGFGEMLGFFRKNALKCRVLPVEKTGRLYRNLKDYLVLDDFDLDAHLLKEGQTFSRDSRSSEKLMHGINVLMAKNYMGEFEWAGKMYRGFHEPLVPLDLWERVQSLLDRRLAEREKNQPRFRLLLASSVMGAAAAR
jgi:hypothetical protein